MVLVFGNLIFCSHILKLIFEIFDILFVLIALFDNLSKLR